jgi:hypothetical protein
VPVTFSVSTTGVDASVTVMAAARVPTALGVKVTVKVQCALAARVDEHGVGPPGTAVYWPLPTMVGLTEVGSLLVRVTVWAALVVATLWGTKVRLRAQT